MRQTYIVLHIAKLRNVILIRFSDFFLTVFIINLNYMHKYRKSILFRQNEILFYKSYSFECFNKLKAKEKQNKAKENQSHSFKNQNTKKKPL